MSDLRRVSSNPHVRSKTTTSNIMMWVVIALLPTTGFGIYNFGLDVLIIILLSVGSAVLAEFLYEKALKKAHHYRRLFSCCNRSFAGP